MEDDGSPNAEPPSPRDLRCALAIEIIDERRALGGAKCAWIESAAAAALGPVALAGGGIRVRIVDDAEMAAAHERWSAKASARSVLPLAVGPAAGQGAPGAVDVDILVCVDEARRQASARGLAPEYEVLLYVVHGVLHCLGHDDHDEAAAASMHAEEDRLLGAAGVGPVYSVAARGAAGAPETLQEPGR